MSDEPRMFRLMDTIEQIAVDHLERVEDDDD